VFESMSLFKVGERAKYLTILFHIED
jgi:hypothetical protein